ncbi:MAG: DUF4432 family protein, partial [Planctomycetaceae bacterium]|nr:DUF4432 family protein [Planctomycetaceae bacterium]
LWMCTQAEADGYVTGLEPGTNFPYPKWIERQQGRLQRLGPGESLAVELTIGIHATSESVTAVSDRIARLQSESPPHIYRTPAPPFTPAD